MGKVYSLTSKEAEKIMEAAIQTLEKRSQVAAIVIVNFCGIEIAKAVMDGVRLFTANVALLKAQQSALTGKSTAQIRNDVQSGGVTTRILGIDPEEFIKWAGGVPVYDKRGHLLGGVGVSNLTQEEDEIVAKAAVNQAGFSDQL